MLKIILMSVLLYTAFLPPNQASDTACHGRSFADFAYGDDWTTGSDLKPDDAWEMVSEIPSNIIESVERPERALLSLLLANRNHLWLGSLENRFLRSPVLFRFNFRTTQWESLPIFTADGSDRIFAIFQDEQSQVWGVTDNPEAVLARFDEETRTFVSISHLPIDNPPETFPLVVVAEGDFWIFTDSGAIYRYGYDVDGLTIEPQSVRLALSPIHAVYHPDGYFVIRMSSGLMGNGRITDEELTSFHIDQQALIPLSVPDEWPSFIYMAVDSDDKLWLGATGYRSAAGEWHLIHPDPENYFSKYYYQGAQPPHLNLIGPDGRLWFDKYADMGYAYEGTAWYDPATGEGCMFTSYPSHVVEGSGGDLWIFIDGALYRLHFA